MKIKSEYTLKCIDGRSIVINENKKKPLNCSIVLNETTSYLWDLAKENDISKEEMLEKLLENFDISAVLALSDIETFVKTLSKFGIFE